MDKSAWVKLWNGKGFIGWVERLLIAVSTLASFSER